MLAAYSEKKIGGVGYHVEIDDSELNISLEI